jgi:hypothetical protein
VENITERNEKIEEISTLLLNMCKILAKGKRKEIQVINIRILYIYIILRLCIVIITFVVID